MSHSSATTRARRHSPIPHDTLCLTVGLAAYWCMARVFTDISLLVDTGSLLASPATLGDTGPVALSAVPLFPVSLFATVVLTLLLSVSDLTGHGYVSSRLLDPGKGPAITGVMGALATGVVVLSSVAPISPVLSLFAATVLGCTAAILTLGWGSLTSRTPSGALSFSIPLGFFLSCVVQQCKTLLPPVPLAVLDVCMPVVSALLWHRVATTQGGAFEQGSHATSTADFSAFARSHSSRSLLGISLVFFCCSLAGGFVERLAEAGVPSPGELDVTLATLVVAGVLAVAVMAVEKATGGRAIASLWVLFVLAILGTLVVLPAVSGSDPHVTEVIVVAEKKSLIVLIWIFLARSAPRTSMPIAAAFGFGHLVLHSFPSFLGQSLGTAAVELLPQAPFDASILGAVMAFVIMTALSFSLYSTGGVRAEFFSMTEAPGYDAGVSLASAAALDTLEQSHRLSQREREILELLARGNGYPAISSKLGISLNTVRTYSQRIYRKCGVHSKQDLVDLVERDANELR